MQPIKLVIQGDFWDSQMYTGRLHLWTMNGQLITINWDNYIKSLMEKHNNPFAIECAFRDSRYLYENDFTSLFQDEEIKRIVLSKFDNLSELKVSTSISELSDFIYGTQNNPFKELPTDTDIHLNKLFAALGDGLWCSSANRNNLKFPISSKPVKLWDCPLLALNAKSKNVALSAGDEGLFQYEISNKNFFESKYPQLNQVEDDIYIINNKNSLFCNWSGTSIYSSSYNGNSYMAAFGWKQDEVNKAYYNRVFKKIVDEQNIFENNSSTISWGNERKIIRAKNNGIEIAKYIQSRIEDERFFSKQDSEYYYNGFTKSKFIPLQQWKGYVISGNTSHFGTIIECENALVIIQNNDSFYNIPGPIVRWRCFPKSKNYTTHLHVILEDRIEIYSFINDYFFNKNLSKEFMIENWV